MKYSSSENNMQENPFFEELLNLKFQERFEVSEDMHLRFLPNNHLKKNKFNSILIAAAGILLLICINLLSIHHYKKQLVKEELKETYSYNWNNLNL